MRQTAEDVADINRHRRAGNPGQAIIEHAWQAKWERQCLAIQCDHQHQFAYVLAVAYNEGEMPHGRIGIWEDFTDLVIPITKPVLAELIEDLRQLLDTLP